MKNFKFYLIAQLVLSVISGVLVSQMSFIGRMGINIAYKEYSVFKSWWQTAAIFFAIQMFLTLLQWIVKSKAPANKSNMVYGLLMIIALVGLYATYSDFTHTFSHKLLREKFHLGFYLFWIAWMIGNVYFLLTKPKVGIPLEAQNLNKI